MRGSEPCKPGAVRLAHSKAGRCASLAGMSLVELMLAVAILGFALSVMLGNLFPLGVAHAMGRERAKVQQIAQVLAERIQGATWHTLGTTAEPWSWHRREGAAANLPQPLQEKATIANNDLQALGILSEASGLRDLRVYLEYYTMNAAVDPLTGVWAIHSAKDWETRRADAQYRLTQDPAAFDLTEVVNAVLVRVLVTWTGRDGAPQRHEINFARRK